tara:strand:+ start:1528 stop:1689 length:162 start_codon:yes stop_codon:yes gene_type:complete
MSDYYISAVDQVVDQTKALEYKDECLKFAWARVRQLEGQLEKIEEDHGIAPED